ncbi:transposase [Streptomyces sp. NPDC102282]|uniref:transposase n=1 Tax=Streptomyces sp. NPDC102282 TaxID=3366154 RepID=UPI003818CE6A
MSSTAPGIGEEWDVLSGLLPRTDTGQPRRPDRVVLNGIVWKLRTDPGWRDVPERGMSPGGRCTHVSAGGRSMACSRSSARGRRPKEGWPRRDGTRLGRFRVELTTKIHLVGDGPMPPARLRRHRRQQQRLLATGASPRADQGPSARESSGWRVRPDRRDRASAGPQCHEAASLAANAAPTLEETSVTRALPCCPLIAPPVSKSTLQATAEQARRHA